ncbi:MAG: LysR family transcriptional regulator [Steroidobacteraceae bacterium]
MEVMPAILFRVDFRGLCSIGRGKIELLEKIARFGSLAQAAREMSMSYRRAWLLMDSMNNSFDARVVELRTGGRGGGNAALTEFGRQLIDTYRELEQELTLTTHQRLQRIIPHVRTDRIPTEKPSTRKAAANNN